MMSILRANAKNIFTDFLTILKLSVTIHKSDTTLYVTGSSLDIYFTKSLRGISKQNRPSTLQEIHKIDQQQQLVTKVVAESSSTSHYPWLIRTSPSLSGLWLSQLQWWYWWAQWWFFATSFVGNISIARITINYKDSSTCFYATQAKLFFQLYFIIETLHYVIG